MALAYIKLVYKALDVVGDGSDPDTMPDTQSLPEGTTLTIKYPDGLDYVIDPTSTPPTTYFPQPISCTFDTQGNLLDPQGNVGVWVIDPNNQDLDPHGYTLTAELNFGGSVAIRNTKTLTIGFVKMNDDGSYDITLNSGQPAFQPESTPASVSAMAAALSAQEAAEYAAVVENGAFNTAFDAAIDPNDSNVLIMQVPNWRMTSDGLSVWLDVGGTA